MLKIIYKKYEKCHLRIFSWTQIALFHVSLYKTRSKTGCILGWLSRSWSWNRCARKRQQNVSSTYGRWLGPAYVIHKAGHEFAIWSQKSCASRRLAIPGQSARTRNDLWRWTWMIMEILLIRTCVFIYKIVGHIDSVGERIVFLSSIKYLMIHDLLY